MMTMKSPHIMIVSGEKSGDYLGAHLMRELTILIPDIRISGVGGEQMLNSGLKESLFPMSDISINGFVKVIFNLRKVFHCIRQTVDYALTHDPDLMILIDSPDFTHRVAKRIRRYKPNMKIICYVAPTVYVWRKNRASAMKKYFNHLLTLLPFEKQVFLNLKGLSSTYVGHPLSYRILEKKRNIQFKKKFSIQENETVIVLLLGSRKEEISSHLKIFPDAIIPLHKQINNLRIFTATFLEFEEEIKKKTQNYPYKLEIISNEEDKQGLYQSAKLALTSSGTMTMELALYNIPMVVAYAVNPVLEHILKKIKILKIPSIVLSNLIVDSPIIPEYSGIRCTAINLSQNLLSLLQNKDVYREQCKGLKKVKKLLQPDEVIPSRKAAEKILEFL